VSGLSLLQAAARVNMTEDMQPRAYPLNFFPQKRATEVNSPRGWEIQNPIRWSMCNQDINSGRNSSPTLHQFIWGGIISESWEIRAPGGSIKR